jgi:tripartite-type tricarboxylate transporter receptor subunit TctC
MAAFSAAAQADYPERTITYLLENPPGGGTDRTHRAFAPFFQKYLGGTFALVNRPGAGGAVAQNELASAKPDGYTIGTVNLPQSVLFMIQRNVRFSVDSFTMIGCVNFDPSSISVRKDSDIKNLTDLFDATRKAEGEFIIGGDISSPHGLNTILLAKKAGVKFKYVYMGGGGPTRAALLGGHIPAMTLGLTAVARHRDQLNILVQTAKERASHAAWVPTARELGYDVVGGVYRPLAVPKETPIEIVEKLREAFAKAMKDPDLEAVMEKQKVPLKYFSGPEIEQIMRDQYNAFKALHEEIPELRKLIKKK